MSDRIWVVEVKINGKWEAQYDMHIHRTYAARLAEKFRRENPHLNKRQVRVAPYERVVERKKAE